MEEKRTIWIVAAVGIFLAVVLLSARIISKGQLAGTKADKKIMASSRESATSQNAPSGWTKTSSSNEDDFDESAPVQQVDDMTVIAKNATIFAIEREQKDFPDNKYSPDEQKSVSVTDTIDLNQIGKEDKTSAESKEKGNEAGADEPFKSVYVGSAKSDEKKEDDTKAAAAAKSVKRPSAVAVKNKETASAPQKPSAPQKTAAAKANDPATWWVQAASFTSLKHADDARQALGRNKINADVFTYKDSMGKVFYRVRVGPYLTKSEAEYWQSRIGQIDTFSSAQSFVTRG